MIRNIFKQWVQSRINMHASNKILLIYNHVVTTNILDMKEILKLFPQEEKVPRAMC
jgi:hypothetical protein